MKKKDANNVLLPHQGDFVERYTWWYGSTISQEQVGLGVGTIVNKNVHLTPSYEEVP